MITFTIPGEPIPQLRARVVRNKFSQAIHSFTPHKCTAHSDRVRLAAQKALADSQFEKLTGAIDLRLDFYVPRPKAAKKRRYPITRPDLSNYAKLIEDSLNGLLWNDDSQIAVSVCRKLFVENGGEPRTEVRISELGIPETIDLADVLQPSLYTAST